MFLSLALIFGLCACGATEPSPQSPAPADSPAPVLSAPEGAVSVATVDELLAAIDTGATIWLEPGVYELTSASNYGRATGSDLYRWENVGDDYELWIHGVSDLTILGASADSTSIVTNARLADVLRFDGCCVVTLDNLTFGHTEGAGLCTGCVLTFNCQDTAYIRQCALFGCGVTGINSQHSAYITVTDSEIYDCTAAAVWSWEDYGMLLENCRIHHCSDGSSSPAYSLFRLAASSGFALVNCEIYENSCEFLLESFETSEIRVLGCEVQDNRFSSGLLNCSEYSPIFEGTAFSKGQLEQNAWPYFISKDTVSLPALRADGTEMSEQELLACEHVPGSYEGIDAYLSSSEPAVPSEQTYVTVQTVDEFLAAIAPYTTINFETGSYILSDASDYGRQPVESPYYRWVSKFDGYELQIYNVPGLRLNAANVQSVSLLTACSYADVIHLEGCPNASVSGMTVGHIPASHCTGNVISLTRCDNSSIDYCRLFGCGILGISANYTSGLNVAWCEIYDCSAGAVEMNMSNAVFTDCLIHDCETPTFYIGANSRILFNGNELEEGFYNMQSSSGCGMWLMIPEAAEFAESVRKDITRGNMKSLVQKVHYPITIAGITYNAPDELLNHCALIFNEDFDDIMKSNSCMDLERDIHCFTFAEGTISFAEFENGEVLISAIYPRSVG